MGTRGQFFLYVKINGKRVLVYSCYSHYDGHEWVGEVYALLSKLLKTHMTVSELVTGMSLVYGDELSLNGDVEASVDVTLELEKPLDTLPVGLHYQPEYFTSYGHRITGYGGGCYYPPGDDDCRLVIPETIADSMVTGGHYDTIVPSDAFRAEAEARRAKELQSTDANK